MSLKAWASLHLCPSIIQATGKVGCLCFVNVLPLPLYFCPHHMTGCAFSAIAPLAYFHILPAFFCHCAFACIKHVSVPSLPPLLVCMNVTSLPLRLCLYHASDCTFFRRCAPSSKRMRAAAAALPRAAHSIQGHQLTWAFVSMTQESALSATAVLSIVTQLSVSSLTTMRLSVSIV
eukprot:1046286-Pelagomonas_calceolata.AAC.1